MGKTAVFVMSILQQINENPKPCTALILCHVRELAFQIKMEVERFTKYMPDVRSAAFFGGVPVQDNIKVIKNPKTAPHIVIGTPGRIE